MDDDKTILNGTSHSASVGILELEKIHNSLMGQPIKEQERIVSSTAAGVAEAGETLVEGGIWALTRGGGEAATETAVEYTGTAVAEIISGTAVEAAGSVAAEAICEAVAEGAASTIGEVIAGIIGGIFDGL